MYINIFNQQTYHIQKGGVLMLPYPHVRARVCVWTSIYVATSEVYSQISGSDFIVMNHIQIVIALFRIWTRYIYSRTCRQWYTHHPPRTSTELFYVELLLSASHVRCTCVAHATHVILNPRPSYSKLQLPPLPPPPPSLELIKVSTPQVFHGPYIFKYRLHMDMHMHYSIVIFYYIDII